MEKEKEESGKWLKKVTKEEKMAQHRNKQTKKPKTMGMCNKMFIIKNIDIIKSNEIVSKI